MAATAVLPRGFFSKYLSARNCFVVNARSYARFANRNPVRVLTSEEASKLHKPTLPFEEEQPTPTANVKPFAKKTFPKAEEIKADLNKNVGSKKQTFIPHRDKLASSIDSYQPSHGTREEKEQKSTTKGQAKSAKSKQVTILQLNSDSGSIQLQVITDKQTAERKLAGHMQNVKSSKGRKAHGLIFLEGERLIAEAIKSGLKATALFVSKPEMLAKLYLPKNFDGELYQVAHEKIQLWSELVTSPGLIGIFSLDNIRQVWSKAVQHVPLTLVCDNIRDPGNMGSIIRCGAAVGCQHIITTPECVDVWDSKVLRAAAGAHFRVNMELNIEWDVIAGSYVSDDTTVILADCLQNRSTNPGPVSPEEITRLSNILAEEEANQISTSRSVEVLQGGDSQQRDTSYLNEKLLKIYRKMPLPQVVYDDVRLSKGQSAILVIGGETHGLSAAAHKLAHQYGGCKAFIPLENEVDSLNASVAAGILTYELRRKILGGNFDNKTLIRP